MSKHRLTIFTISLKNLKKNSLRTKSLIAILAVFTFSVFCGGLLSQSLSLGKNYMSGKMGADIMVVPRGYSLDLQNTLLRSESNTFYMYEDPSKGISALPGVKQVASQAYIGALNATCCTVPVQLIGFDPKTDFTIKSWMTNIDSSRLGFGEVVTGSRVNSDLGNSVWFFGQPLKVVAKLENTGMGFDSSVFMTMETAKHMIEMSRKTAVHPAGNEKQHISALFIKLYSGADIAKTAKIILNKYPHTDVVILREMMQHVSSQLNNIKGLIYTIQGLLWIASILILAVLFTVTTNERKRELGLLLALGATRKKLETLLVTETFIVSVLGGLCGVMAAFFIMYEFRMLIAISLGLPYMQPTVGSTAILAAVSLLLSVFTSTLASLHSVIRTGDLEPQIIIREYE